MNNRSLAPLLLLASVIGLLLAGCGGSDASAAEHADASGTTPVPSSATATPTAAAGQASPRATPTATPTPAITGSTPPPANAPEPVAYVDAVVSESADGLGFDIVVMLEVADRGVSAIELTATASTTAVAIRSADVGPLLGADPLVAVNAISEETATVAYARAGASVRSDASGLIATLHVDATSAEQARAGLAISLSFTDAGLALHGPFAAAYDTDSAD